MEQQNEMDKNLKFELKFELDNYEINKLKTFAKSSDSDSLLLIHDATDVLNSMFIQN